MSSKQVLLAVCNVSISPMDTVDYVSLWTIDKVVHLGELLE